MEQRISEFMDRTALPFAPVSLQTEVKSPVR
jgi:hypothetical protein